MSDHRTIEISPVPVEYRNLWVTVYDATTGYGILDASVTPWVLVGVDPDTGEETWWKLEALKQLTDEKGLATLLDLEPNIYAVRVTVSGYKEGLLKNINLVEYDQSVEVALDKETLWDVVKKALPILVLLGVMGATVTAITKA